MKYKLSIPIQIKLGVPEDERSEPQEIVVKIKFKTDTTKAQESDRIEDCPVDYQQIYDLLHEIAKKEFHLLESLHYSVLEALKTSFPQIEKWKVKLYKEPWEKGYVEVSGH